MLWVDPDLTPENVDSRQSIVDSRPPSAEHKAELEAMIRKLGADGAIGHGDHRLEAYPNPFEAHLRITYDLRSAEHVSLHVFDLLGRRVATLVDSRQSAGPQSFKWDAIKDGLKLADGLYFLQLRAGKSVQTRSISLTR